MNATPEGAARSRTTICGRDGKSSRAVDAVVDPAEKGLEGCEGEQDQTNDDVGIGPDIKMYLELDGDPDAEAAAGGVEDVGAT